MGGHERTPNIYIETGTGGPGFCSHVSWEQVGKRVAGASPPFNPHSQGGTSHLRGQARRSFNSLSELERWLSLQVLEKTAVLLGEKWESFSCCYPGSRHQNLGSHQHLLHPRVNTRVTTLTATEPPQRHCAHRASFLSSPPPTTLPKLTPRTNKPELPTVVLPPPPPPRQASSFPLFQTL